MIARYSKEQRDKAKSENRALIAIEVTGRKGKGGMAFCGPATDGEAKKVSAFMLEIVKARSEKKS